ncbi:MAG: DUF5336 domain-containing protein [Myxococcota bacterium]
MSIADLPDPDAKKKEKPTGPMAIAPFLLPLGVAAAGVVVLEKIVPEATVNAWLFAVMGTGFFALVAAGLIPAYRKPLRFLRGGQRFIYWLAAASVVVMVPYAVRVWSVWDPEAPRSAYNYRNFEYRHYLDPTPPTHEVGTELPDVTLYNLSGAPTPLSELTRERPLLIEVGSWSSTAFLTHQEEMDSLSQDTDKVRFIIVYGREAHPGNALLPFMSLEEKLARARDMSAALGTPREVFVDDLEGSFQRLIGTHPNPVALVGVDRVLAARADWNKPDQLVPLVEVLHAGDGEAFRVSPVDVRGNPPSGADFGLTYGTLQRAGIDAMGDFLVHMTPLAFERVKAEQALPTDAEWPRSSVVDPPPERRRRRRVRRRRR